MPLLDFFLNKSRAYMIPQRSSNPHTSGLGVGLAVVAVHSKALRESGLVSFWDTEGDKDLLVIVGWP